MAEEADAEVQLEEVIAHQQELEDTANAVLGDSDDTNCSYPKVRQTSTSQTERNV